MLPICKCGLAMSKNPHLDAGKPFTLLEVGPVWVCIPCQSATLHKWCCRALNAEKKLSIIKDKIDEPTTTQEGE